MFVETYTGNHGSDFRRESGFEYMLPGDRINAIVGDCSGCNAQLPRESLVSTLDAIDLSSVQAPEHYQKELKRLQKEIYQLSFRAYKKGISSTLIFEGWDAAGKGGAIRRLTAGTDARITRVIPISAPSDEELAHHYLWRFWRHIPRAGFITIYDRSWYGRVLVERVEKLTPKEDWARA